MNRLLVNILQWVRNFTREKFHSKNEALPYYISILIAGVFFIIALNAFIELTDELAENELGVFDDTITDFVLSFRQNSLTDFFTFMTHAGDRFAYLAIALFTGAYFFIRHRSWKFILQIILVLALSTLSNVVLKNVINRARPSLEHLVTVNTLSYPSGHSMSAMAFYGFLAYLTIRLRMRHWMRVVIIALLVFIILSVGLSRIYLGVHYPSDVAAGFAGGLIWVTFCIIVFNLTDLLRKRKLFPADTGERES